MKKILLALVIASATMLSFNSCTKEYITNNSMLPGVSYVYENVGNWTRQGTSNTFFTDIAISDLDDRYFQDGHVTVSLQQIDELQGNRLVYEIIPSVVGFYNYNVNYSVGRVRIYAEYLGDQTTPVAPGPQVVKVVLTDADVGN